MEIAIALGVLSLCIVALALAAQGLHNNITFIRWIRHKEWGDCVALVKLNGEETRVRGSVTVWHEEETGRRLSTGLESFMCDMWKKENYRKERIDG